MTLKLPYQIGNKTIFGFSERHRSCIRKIGDFFHGRWWRFDHVIWYSNGAGDGAIWCVDEVEFGSVTIRTFDTKEQAQRAFEKAAGPCLENGIMFSFWLCARGECRWRKKETIKAHSGATQ